MKSFYDKEEYTILDIESLITNEVEESIYLDFKESAALDKTDGKRKEISKDVSSFANSDGGIIIYGIKEENHKASALSFINGNVYTKEWLEQVINSGVQRHIPDLKIFPIRQDGKIENTIYIIKVPKSSEAPHISKDKRFYKRFNFESVALDEYEIRELYNRKTKSILAVNSWKIYKTESDEDNTTKFQCEVCISNDGDIPEASYKLNIYLKNYNKHLDVSWSRDHTNIDYTVLETTRVKISSVGKVPIFPNEVVNAIRFNITVQNEKIIPALTDVQIEIRVLYPGGTDAMHTDLDDILKKVIGQDNS
ncbi:MAG: putative DNA-binding protein [Chitinophagaceae bacterium]|nr:putative DNA-binding protein [Chitinophagaceae bacterium]